MENFEKIVEASKDGWSDWMIPKENTVEIMCCECATVHIFEFATVHEGVPSKAHAIFRTKLVKKDG